MHSVVRPRPRGQVCGHEPAREDAGAPPMRTGCILFSKTINPRRRSTARCGEEKAIWTGTAPVLLTERRRILYGIKYFLYCSSSGITYGFIKSREVVPNGCTHRFGVLCLWYRICGICQLGSVQSDACHLEPVGVPGLWGRIRV